MAKQVIAVDLDDVLAATAPAWVEFSNQRWGTNLTADDYNEDWALMWQVDRQTEAKRANEIYAKLFTNIPHHSDAYDVLKRLAKRYHLVIATSRVYRIRQDTLDWLEQNFGGIFRDVHHSGIYDAVAEGRPLRKQGAAMKTKASLIKKISADYLIDDQPKHCLAAAEMGVEAIIFGDYAWGRDIGPLPPRVSRCVNWQEVGAYFDQRN